MRDSKVFFNYTLEGLSNPTSTAAKVSPGFNFAEFKAYFATLHPVNFLGGVRSSLGGTLCPPQRSHRAPKGMRKHVGFLPSL
jgi:hypothetical protein